MQCNYEGKWVNMCHHVTVISEAPRKLTYFDLDRYGYGFLIHGETHSDDGVMEVSELRHSFSLTQRPALEDSLAATSIILLYNGKNIYSC